MNSDYLDIQFTGFQPQVSERQMALDIARKVELAAPSDAFIRFDLQKTWKGYVGICMVRSTMFSFNVEAEHEDFVDLLDTLFKQMNSQLMSWKARRFNSSYSSSNQHVFAS